MQMFWRQPNECVHITNRVNEGNSNFVIYANWNFIDSFAWPQKTLGATLEIRRSNALCLFLTLSLSRSLSPSSGGTLNDDRRRLAAMCR